jgi:hypothetical protein
MVIARRPPVKENVGGGGVAIIMTRRWKVAIFMIFGCFALIIVLVITTAQSRIKRIGHSTTTISRYDVHLLEEGKAR